ncbi:MAG: hypothetical protein HY537_05735 [Deltaproteobacteria bacterium]|nr:hypothetical protein [Deltaproteobacteria bacterium]
MRHRTLIAIILVICQLSLPSVYGQDPLPIALVGKGAPGAGQGNKPEQVLTLNENSFTMLLKTAYELGNLAGTFVPWYLLAITVTIKKGLGIPFDWIKAARDRSDIARKIHGEETTEKAIRNLRLSQTAHAQILEPVVAAQEETAKRLQTRIEEARKLADSTEPLRQKGEPFPTTFEGLDKWVERNKSQLDTPWVRLYQAERGFADRLFGQEVTSGELKTFSPRAESHVRQIRESQARQEGECDGILAGYSGADQEALRKIRFRNLFSKDNVYAKPTWDTVLLAIGIGSWYGIDRHVRKRYGASPHRVIFDAVDRAVVTNRAKLDSGAQLKLSTDPQIQKFVTLTFQVLGKKENIEAIAENVKKKWKEKYGKLSKADAEAIDKEFKILADNKTLEIALEKAMDQAARKTISPSYLPEQIVSLVSNKDPSFIRVSLRPFIKELIITLLDNLIDIANDKATDFIDKEVRDRLRDELLYAFEGKIGPPTGPVPPAPAVPASTPTSDTGKPAPTNSTAATLASPALAGMITKP